MHKPLTKENKKQEILDYVNSIDSSTLEKDPSTFSKTMIVEKMADETYSQKTVGTFIEELTQEGLLEKNKINIELLYPKEKKKEIVHRWKKYLRPYDDLLILTLIYIITIISTYFMKRDSLDAAIMYPIILLVTYNCFQWAFNMSLRYLPFLSKINVKLFVSNGVSLVIVGLIGYFGSKIFNQTYNVTTLLTSIGVAVTIGTVVYKIALNKD
jgi:hypothetical protein